MMKLKHNDRKEIANTTATRNAFATAAILGGTLMVTGFAAGSPNNFRVADESQVVIRPVNGDGTKLDIEVVAFKPAIGTPTFKSLEDVPVSVLYYSAGQWIRMGADVVTSLSEKDSAGAVHHYAQCDISAIGKHTAIRALFNGNDSISPGIGNILIGDDTSAVATPAPKVRGDFQVQKMTFDIKPMKAGDTLFLATNVCETADIAVLRVGEVRVDSVQIAATITKDGKATEDAKTVGYDKEAVVGVFTVTARAGSAPGTVNVDYHLTNGLGCSQAKSSFSFYPFFGSYL